MYPLPNVEGVVSAESRTPKRLPVQMRGESASFWRAKLKDSIDPIVGEAAWQGYAADGHGSQSCQRVHERGGFGLAELGYYIARAVDEGRVRIEIVERR